jgi:pheophorbide a oxygenase
LQVLDRFEQHTQKCSSCIRAYASSFQTLQKFLIGATVAFCATAGIPSDQFRAVLAALALVSAGLAYTLNQHEKNFVFIDYVHAEID